MNQLAVPGAVPTVTSIADTMLGMRASYEAARETKFLRRPEDMPTWGTGADYHTRIEADFWYMLEFSRHIERNDPVVGQGVSRFATNVVQSGYGYKPETGNDRIDRLLKERWESWTDSDNRAGTDYAMQHCWNDMERLSVRRMIFDGDCSFNPMANGTLQSLEAHRMRTPIYRRGTHHRRRRYVVNGVEKNRKDQVVRYWITRHESDEYGMSRSHGDDSYAGVFAWDLDEVTGQNEANFFHLMMCDRFSQSRGVTAMAPVLNTAGMHGDVQFAKLVQQQMVSYVAFVHEVPFAIGNDYSPPEYAQEYCPRTGELRSKAPDLAPGAEYWGHHPGEVIKPFSANIPNAEFFDQARMLLTFISLQLGMPLILFLLDASETNFSSWRAAVDQAKLAFGEFQRQHSRCFHSPVLRWKQRRWLRQDRGFRRFFAVNGPDFFHHSWHFPGWPYVEPLKDVQADAAEMAANLNSPRRILARRKLNFETIADEIALDNEYLITRAIESADRINKHKYIVDHPDERITWREVAHPNMGDDLQMQLLDKAGSSDDQRSQDPVSQDPVSQGAAA